MREWLTAHHIPFEDEILKKDLLDIMNSVRWKYDVRKIDERAKERGHRVLQVPP
jgi:hypothetical protein